MSGTDEVEYAVVSGWLVEVMNAHTCGTDIGGYYGAHEPGCGTVPIATIEDLLRDGMLRTRIEAALARPLLSEWAKRYWRRDDSVHPKLAITIEDDRKAFRDALDDAPDVTP